MHQTEAAKRKANTEASRRCRQKKKQLEEDLREGFARRGHHLRRLLRTIAERDATIAKDAAVIIKKDEEVRDAKARADAAEAARDEADRKERKLNKLKTT